ncbi:hypothetical protein SPACI_033320 [Sporomusa acidovorans DSM 3132]|uniref:Sodium-dependent dicarboxylate transporter SdcS n=1 Tax=Sporomusa acidovorans (strain ATCC 49682 / DSM 3132 / Mol) TaxID=1123286 RepID=A0ABZ3J591_SPOA4|nr:sodium-dependent dicarboxylate transporter SdcS [Sporomusa acidovorans DSM 3132]SDF00258.1 solute carrier family 13 (sodium-dependent dicarboxylate transporter), member 2/3/5 [Sporomusa acidovorans]
MLLDVGIFRKLHRKILRLFFVIQICREGVTLTKKIIGLILGVIFLIGAKLVSPPAGLSEQGLLSLGILASGIALWICETLPSAITGLLLMVLVPIFNLMDMTNAFKNFGNISVFFIIASFSIVVILRKTKIPEKIVARMMNWAGTNPEKLVFGFLFCTATLSTVVSNTPDALMFLGLSYPILKAVNAKPGSSNLGKCLMIGIPISAMIGGFGTPAGTNINILAMSLFEQATGTAITFVQWMYVGVPMYLIMTTLTWFSLVKIFKPEPITEEILAEVRSKASQLGQSDAYEQKVIIAITTLFVLWIAGSWIPALNTTIVAIVGLVAMFLPKIELMTWDEFCKGVPWAVVIVFGSVNVVAAAVLKHGAAQWIADLFIHSTQNMAVLPILLFFSLLIVCMHAVFPVGPAAVAMFTAPMVAVANAGGFSPVIIAFVLAFGFGATWLLPINPVFLLTYNEGYYKMTDTLKAGILPSIGLIVTLAVVVPFIVSLIGL